MGNKTYTIQRNLRILLTSAGDWRWHSYSKGVSGHIIFYTIVDILTFSNLTHIPTSPCCIETARIGGGGADSSIDVDDGDNDDCIHNNISKIS